MKRRKNKQIVSLCYVSRANKRP